MPERLPADDPQLNPPPVLGRRPPSLREKREAKTDPPPKSDPPPKTEPPPKSEPAGKEVDRKKKKKKEKEGGVLEAIGGFLVGTDENDDDEEDDDEEDDDEEDDDEEDDDA